jgi:hypothetical protein
MTEELAQGLWDVLQGQERLMDLIEQLAEDTAQKPGKGAHPAGRADRALRIHAQPERRVRQFN